MKGFLILGKREALWVALLYRLLGLRQPACRQAGKKLSWRRG